MQFGDDIMGSATDEMRAMLQRKHQWKREFHAGREHGMLPPARRDPEIPKRTSWMQSIDQNHLHHRLHEDAE